MRRGHRFAGWGGGASGLLVPLVVLCLALVSPRVFAQTSRPATQPAGLEVHDWVVFIVEPSNPLANGDGLFTHTLPPFVATTRQGDSNRPTEPATPVGVITFRGSSPRVAARVEVAAGRFASHWPAASGAAPSRLTWDVALQQGGNPSSLVSDNHWFALLRKAGDVSVIGSAVERFLLYDAQVPIKPAVKLDLRPDGLMVIEGSELLDLTFYQGDRTGWSSATPVPLRGQAPPAATQPVSKIEFGPRFGGDSLWVLGAWGDRLQAAGLAAAETDAILAVLRAHATDQGQITAVYRLSADEMDKLVPMTFEPAPTKRVRVGLVIVRGIDPTLNDRTDRLIAQLGDDQWKKREEATQQLAAMGKLARPRLTEALKSKDPEIAMRAEQLLAKIQAKDQPRPRRDGRFIID